MKLIDLVQNPNQAESATICARRPWTADSDVYLVAVGTSKIPEQVVGNGYEYFIEGWILRDVLEIPETKRYSERQKADLIIFYAENDAYPPWIFQD